MTGIKSTPLHWAAFVGSTATVWLLLRAAPDVAAVADSKGKVPLAWALQRGHVDAACCLLAEAPMQLAGGMLALLAGAGAAALPLYPTLVARQPLTAPQWALLPSPCPSLAAALPTVLHRSASEASLLVRRLLPGQQQLLRTFALCLARVQQRLSASLPTPIVWHLLALGLMP